MTKSSLCFVRIKARMGSKELRALAELWRAAPRFHGSFASPITYCTELLGSVNTGRLAFTNLREPKAIGRETAISGECLPSLFQLAEPT